ncbi:tetratricopeptide repeat protein [Actinoplanes sp. DH11]|uniref:tetratricopeptide repeat protein n=1 Tax=Actinoplanes sp. DH11 TaxID=2857011 RepID=UPI001E52BA23|nr:tetratricopeptide repeat protein [Actinoplanes sp. DH11]
MTLSLDDALLRADELRERGRYPHAEAVLEPLVSRVDRQCGRASIAAARVRNSHGLLLKATGRYAEARDRYLEALAIAAAFGDEYADDVATLHHNLAGIEFVLGDLAAAATWGREGLDLRRRTAGADHLSVLYDEGNLAPILLAAGECDAAEGLLLHVLDHFRSRLGADDYEVAVALTNLGALAAERGDLPLALERLTEAVRIKSARLGPDHPELIRTLINIAVVAEKLGDAAESSRAVAWALTIAGATLPPDHTLRRTLETW